MKNYIIICLFLVGLVSWPAFGNRLPEKWEPGVIHLHGESLRGDVSYDPKLDVVFRKAEGKIQTFTPQTVHHFEIYDAATGLTRTYSSLFHEKTTSRDHKAFYEVVAEGDLTLVQKGEFVSRPRPQGKYHRVHNKIRDSHQKPEIVYSNYLVLQAVPQKITDFQRQVLPLMHDLEEEMGEFMQRENLDLGKAQNHIRIINHSNYLKRGFLSSTN
ncbi:hypothetical protein BH24BAC1_BH24BAC1_38800 [soil metagenome]